MRSYPRDCCAEARAVSGSTHLSLDAGNLTSSRAGKGDNRAGQLAGVQVESGTLTYRRLRPPAASPVK
jgi:hypothetical protein